MNAVGSTTGNGSRAEKGAAGAQAGSSQARRELWFFAKYFVPSRILLLAAVALVTGGREVSTDVALYHPLLVDDPLAMLQGRPLGPVLENAYPPFLSLMMGALVWPLRLLAPEFYVWRLAYAFYEGLMGVFLVLALAKLVKDEAVRRRVTIAFLACPVGWLTSVIKPQD
jgi:hypothetical protein